MELDSHPNAQWHNLIRKNDTLNPNSISQLIKLLINISENQGQKSQLKSKINQSSAITYAQDSGWCNIWQQVSESKSQLYS